MAHGYNGMSRPLAVIGQFALWSFLLHRVILQLMHRGMIGLELQWSQELQYFSLLSTTMVCIWISCKSRASYPEWNSFLKRLYL